jgi:hypothetical protein
MTSQTKKSVHAMLCLFALQVAVSSAAVPPPPIGLTAVGGDGSVQLSWSPVSGNPTSYQVKRGNTGAGPFTVVGSPAATSDTDVSVGNFRTYYYVVSAVNSDGEGPDSTSVRAMPVNGCGAEGAQCSGASSACLQPAYCASQPLRSGAIPVSLGHGASTRLALPAFATSGNVKIEVGTVNMAGFQPMAPGTNTALLLFNASGTVVASNDNYGADPRSYLSYIDAIANVGTPINYFVGVTCIGPSPCAGTVAYRFRDLAHTSCSDPKYAAKGTVCRAATDECDVAETCSGDSPDCAPDALYDDHHVCRPSTGACDIEERCTGTSKACPADRALPAGVVCRGSAGGCDPAEVCDGTSKLCAADVLAPAGTVCRAALGPLDTDHVCSGTSASCPADTDADTCLCSKEVKGPPIHKGITPERKPR